MAESMLKYKEIKIEKSEMRKFMLEQYKTVYQGGTGEIVEKKSRFIATVRPVKTEEEAMLFIEEMKKNYWDARHNCSAWVIGERRESMRCSDDGEPQGTAGKPMLDVLLGEELYNTAVVVTRYFGGTLLGAGGLVRAYTEGAAIAVRAARPRVMSPCTVLQMDIDYGQYGKITYILPKYHTVTLESDFGAAVRMQILIKDKYIEAFRKELTELTSATVVPYELEHRFDEIPE